MSNNEIKLVQSPVIAHALVEAGKGVTERLANLNIENTIATIETVKGLKELRAELNKELADFENQRKFLKDGVMNPYNEFEAIYKTEISEKYKNAIELLKDKIAIVEDKIKEEKKENVKSYFVELCLSEDIDFVSFPQVGLEINLSTTEKAYKEKCNEFIKRITDDVNLINTFEFPAEIMAEFKRNGLSAANAIKTVKDRKEAERQEKERLRLNEIQRRTRVLSGLCLVFKSFTQTYEYVSDENIYIESKFIETSTKEEFADKVILIEQLIQNKKAQEAKEREAAAQSAAGKQGPIQQVIPQAVVINQPPVHKMEPLQAPVVESKPIEELKTAAFEVTGTLTQLRALGQYMKENNLTYRNI